MIDFLTSKTGIFAAFVALVGLIASLWKLWTDVKDRRAKSAEAELAAQRRSRGLEIVDPQLSQLSASSNAYDLQFVVTNTGANHLIMRTLRLHVTMRTGIDRTVPSYTMAPIAVYKHRVSIGPEKDVYDIRERTFGKGHEPLAFEPGEASAFLVKLVSTETMRYTFQVEAGWYDAADPNTSGEVHSSSMVAEFPDRVSAGPAT